MKYLLHADGKLPNFALMRLATYFRSRGERVRLIRGLKRRDILDPIPGIGDVFGSSIFDFAASTRAKLDDLWGHIVWGGTGVDLRSDLASLDAGVDWDQIAPDYADYPEYTPSLGFLTRGCRLRCPFCVVPEKEGKPRIVADIARVYRGGHHPKRLVLLDNDAFTESLADFWERTTRELNDGGFKVCFSQGLNLRLITPDSARLVASLEYRDNEFQRRQLYTAWDNLRDEGIFRRGVETLRQAGVPHKELMVYMLVGYRPEETWDELMYRFNTLVGLGAKPYPMVYDRTRKDLKAFKRWAITGLYRAVPFEKYDVRIKTSHYATFNALRDKALTP